MLELAKPGPILTPTEIRAIEMAARRSLDGSVWCAVCGVEAPMHADDCAINRLFAAIK